MSLTLSLWKLYIQSWQPENKDKVNDFIFDCYKSLGYTAGCKYLEPSITYDYEECKKILGIVPNSPQEYGFNEGWINAH